MSRKNYNIQKGDKVLLSTKNLIERKLDRLYIGAFKVQDIKGITVYLKLPIIGIFPKFHVSLLKRAPNGIPLAKDWHYQRREEYEVEEILDERKEIDEFLIKQKGFPEEENIQQRRKHLKNAQRALRKFRRAPQGGPCYFYDSIEVLLLDWLTSGLISVQPYQPIQPYR